MRNGTTAAGRAPQLWLHDVQGTLLRRPGLGPNELSYPHLGRRERLTLVEGKVIEQVV